MRIFAFEGVFRKGIVTREVPQLPGFPDSFVTLLLAGVRGEAGAEYMTRCAHSGGRMLTESGVKRIDEA